LIFPIYGLNFCLETHSVLSNCASKSLELYKVKIVNKNPRTIWGNYTYH